MKTYIVKGYAFVPVECSMVIQGENESDAIGKAKDKFDNSKSKSDYIVPGTVEEISVFDWEPSSATELTLLTKGKR